ncbi:MAG: hypothetical protein ABFD16_22120 [Thermoguttaceae bacterium]|jgi:hypothetical protein
MVGHAAALVLGQLAFWFGNGDDGATRARIMLEGKYWVHKTYKQLALETGLTECQVRDAARKLVARGLLIRRPGKAGTQRTSFYRFNYDELERQWDAAVAAGGFSPRTPPSLPLPQESEEALSDEAPASQRGSSSRARPRN